MKINSTKFHKSSSTIEQCPKPNLPEYAFIGRSNVGKSSLINMLLERNNLAKTSNTPGKTQLINHFNINDNWYLVDLPGYGYAKVSKKKREEWNLVMQNYLLKRENLECIFQLIDIRIKPQQIDLDFSNWLIKNELPFVLIFTKKDKLKKKQKAENVENYKNEILKTWGDLPDIFISSANKKIGRIEILNFIASLNKEFFQ